MAGTTTYLGISYPQSTDLVKDGALNMETIATGFDTAVAIPTFNAQTGTTYTFAFSDIGKTVSASNAAASVYTVTTQALVDWPAGTTLNLVNLGAGTVSVAGAVGVTVSNTAATLSQYASASIVRTGLDSWSVIPFAGGVSLLTDSAISGTTGSPTTATYTSGGIDYKTYTFTGSGSITLGKAGLVDCLLVGGGGNGAGPGGGGGGLIENQIYLPASTHTITVGAGSSGSGSGYGQGGISAIGIATRTYLNFVMGGGAGGITGANSGGGGTTAPAPASSLLGNIGGVSLGLLNTTPGGGGLGAAGGNSPSNGVGGAGGAGINNSFTTGSNIGYGGGGGGAGQSTGGASGGFGATAGTSSGVNSANATANTGGGAGGSWAASNGNGGSGVVSIRVKA